MPGAKGRRGKKEKKIGNLKNLSKAEGSLTSVIIQGIISGTLNAGVQSIKSMKSKSLK